MAVTSSNIDYLIDKLRLELGDITTPYRYTDDWLRTSLVGSVETLQKWWTRKYTVSYTDDYATATIERNTADWSYTEDNPPIIQTMDTRPIILMASIVLLGGQLENFSWNVSRWKDAEISYSNIAGADLKKLGLTKRWDELTGFLTPPNKRLRPSKKGELPGYKNNQFESGKDF